MTRQFASPSESTQTLKRFLGMNADLSGVEVAREGYTTLQNVRNISLRGLKPRKGGVKVFDVTDNDGSVVYGLHTFVDDSGAETYLKAANSRIQKSTGSTWSDVGAVTTLAGATTFFANLSTKDTGSSNSTSGTTTGATATSIAVAGAGWTINAYVGQVLTVNNEIKRIVGNDTENIYVAERFDTIPSSASFTVNPRSQEFFFANGTNFYKCDTSTLTRLDNLTFAYAFTGIEAHVSRLWGWRGTRLHWSDLGVGEHFSRNSWRDFQTPIMRVISFGSVLVIFERRKVTVMFGDNPDNFTFVEVLSQVGTCAPKSVGAYGEYLFFLSDHYGVCVLSLQSIGNTKETNEPLSVSKNYMQSLIIGPYSVSEMANAACGVFDGIYHLIIDNRVFVLDVESSFDAPRDPQSGNVQWIWSLDSYPEAMTANVYGLFGTKFVIGSSQSGQVYEIETGFTDDGTAISWSIEKLDWQIGEPGTVNKFMSFYSRQLNDVDGTCNINYFFTTDVNLDSGTTPTTTIDLNTATTADHKLRVTGNPSNNIPRNSGRNFSFQIYGETDVEVPVFEQFNLLYRPGILQ